MGNQVLENYNKDRSFELYLEDLGNINVEKEIGSGRLFTTVQCWSEENQFIIVKVYLKPSSTSPALVKAKKIILQTHQQLSSGRNPNILPYSRIFETDKAAYLIRPFVHRNLTDRLSTRPFLNIITKKWITYQLLVSLCEIHRQQRYHGDLKSSNVLLTGWDWVFLTDLGNFKPLQLSKSDTRTMFAAYFDTSGRSLTTLAPERIMIDPKVILDTSKPLDHDEVEIVAELRQKADTFSLGCVIAEVFLDGQELFQFEQLLVFRNGNTEHIDKMTDRIENPSIRTFVKKLVQYEPKARPNSQKCLRLAEKSFIPGYFRVLHQLFAQLLYLSSDKRLMVIDRFFWDVLHVLRSNGEVVSGDLKTFILTGKYEVKKMEEEDDDEEEEMRKFQKEKEEEETEGEEDEDEKVERKSEEKKEEEEEKKEDEMMTLLDDTKKLISYIQGAGGTSGGILKDVPDDGVFRYGKEDVKPQRFKIIGKRVPTATSITLSKRRKIFKIRKSEILGESKEGIDLLTSLVCSSIPNANSITNLLQSLHHLKILSYYSTDYTIIQRIIPYTCRLLTDTTLPTIKSGAINTLAFALEQMTTLPRSETNLFTDYILPYLIPLAHDKSELVRCTFAENLPLLAYQSRKLLELESLVLQRQRKKKISLQQSSNTNTPTSLNEEQPSSINVSSGMEGRKFFDEKLLFLKTEFLRLVEDLSKDKITEVKISLLRNMGSFCSFCGTRITRTTVLPLLTSFLNSNAWRLRAAFFETVASAARFIGVNGIKEIVLPCIDPLLCDADEFVVDSVLQGIMALTKQDMIGRQNLLDIIYKISPLLIHPNPWIRSHTIGSIVEASKKLGDVDTYCFVLPSLKPYLSVEENIITVVNEYTLLEGLIEPVSLDLYERGIAHFTNKVSEEKFMSLEEWKKLLDLSTNYKLTQNDINRLLLLSPFILKTGEQLRKRQTVSSSSAASILAPQVLSGATSLSSSVFDGVRKGGKLKFNQMTKEGLDEESLTFQAFFETDSPVQNVVIEAVREKGDFLKKRAISLRAAGVGENKKGSRRGAEDSPSSPFRSTSSATSSPVGHSSLYEHVSSRSQHQHHPSSQPFRPIGNLYTESYEHHDEVTSLWFVDDPNQHFLISSSKDFTVKVWDVRSMGGPSGTGRPKRETYLFRSMLTYPLPGHHVGYSTDVCCLPMRPLIALTTSRGWMQIWDYSANRVTDTMIIQDGRAVFLEDHKVEYGRPSKHKDPHHHHRHHHSLYKEYDKYNNSKLRNPASMNVVRPLSLDNTSVLLVGTETGNVHVVDKKSHAEIFTLKSESSLRKGPISCICGTESWIVCGTERGFLTLWDLRFQLPVHTVRISSEAIHELMVLPPSSVLIANASSVVHEWSLEKNRKVRSFQCYHYDNNIIIDDKEEEEEKKRKKIQEAKKKKKTPVVPDGEESSELEFSSDEDEEEEFLRRRRRRRQRLRYGDDNNIEEEKDEKEGEEDKTTKEENEKVILTKLRGLMKEARVTGVKIEGSLGDTVDGKYDPFGIEELEKLAWEKRKGTHEILSLCWNDKHSFFSVGTDRFVRLWNMEVPQNSYVLSGLENNQLAVYKSRASQAKKEGRAKGVRGGRHQQSCARVQENILTEDFEEDGNGVFNIPMKSRHKDSIVKCCVVNNKRGGMKLLTADKDGVMKFWD